MNSTMSPQIKENPHLFFLVLEIRMQVRLQIAWRDFCSRKVLEKCFV